jgi:hypothetical protein
MYSFDEPANAADEHAGSAPGEADHAEDAERAARAVQVALDRRDNGGDATPGRPA